ncbi:MAG: MATE family efflux transporter [Phascolarctobacterium sp.]|nr:MATE family efflux transporter [Phascolarctobacterium sp.]
MIKALDRNYRDKLRRLLSVMLPIICTQIAIMGMNFFDASMSGQAGDVDLAGAAIGGNIWMPIQTGISGILMAAMPLVANLLGAGEKEKITVVVRHGLVLALGFALLVLGCGIAFLPHFLQGMGLAPEVYHVALWYLAGLGLGVVPFFMITPLRSLVDTLGYTHLTMRIYLLALPINACLNYVLIFGKLGLPRLGGVGAGVASGLTFWLLLAIFAWVVSRLEPFKSYHIFGFVRPVYSWLKEYLRIGVPMGISIFMETSIFGVVALFIAKFGTETIAAHQAALNFSSLIYMLPLSFSLALTIVVGVEYGAKNYQGARDYVTIGLQTSLGIAGFYMLAEYFLREQIAFIYTNNVEVVALVKVFLLYAIGWQAGDAIAAPIQGILRGYKDVNATFWASMLAYWGICLPLGLFLDYKVGNGAFAYWQSLDCGVISSATLLSIRLIWLQRKISNM